MNIQLWLRCNAYFLTNISWKFCINRNIFNGDIKENAWVFLMLRKNTHSRCFYLGGKRFDLYIIFRVSLWELGIPSKSKLNIHCYCCADSQTFYQMFIFYRETHYFYVLEYLITHKHTLKILCKSKHFPQKYKRKRVFSEHSVYPIYPAAMHVHILKVWHHIKNSDSVNWCVFTRADND